MNYWIRLTYIGKYGQTCNHLFSASDYKRVKDVLSVVGVNEGQILRSEINGREIDYMSLKRLLEG